MPTETEKTKNAKAKQKKKGEKMSVKDHIAVENNVESDEELSDNQNFDEKLARLSQESLVEQDISEEAEEKAAEALLNSSNSSSSNGKIKFLFFIYMFD